MHQECFSAFVRFKIIQDGIMNPKRRNGNFNGVILAVLAASLWLQVRGGSGMTDAQS